MADKTDKAEANVLNAGQRNSIANAIVTATDSHGQARSMLDGLLKVVGVRGIKGKPLPTTDVNLIGDVARDMYAKRGAAETSLDALVSAAKKLARCSPVLAGMDNLDEIASGVNEVKRFCTFLQKADFDTASATKAFNAKPKANYAKSAASHIKALLGMKDGTFLDAPSRAALVLWAEQARFEKGKKFDLGKIADEHRDTKAATKFFH